ncbi:IS200/IS605 family accessory protein TnpB-related protein [Nostoc sp. CHAB 5784]|uniref:IS200/IS605 family accessory protein TnpB-related protein n=1 Tax=Nostoc mirabile TaxID=2907820 RepID=UPI001E489190|nr:IS200/IS605 family accessory protein TnpB-related protein [Nostoc mirabile]MCC5667289.1 IS200/IS605 family accessory protein TnpB-related protein [Nostoc mirabile CHAB5784]
MSKARTKRKAAQEIRTDVWDLSADNEQKHKMVLTIEAYRKFLIPLVIVINAQWQYLGELTAHDKVNAVEKMIHKTADNPNHKHKYFQIVVDKYQFFKKFPSYLRRAAIADAIGIVSSFQSRYYEWQSGIRKHKAAKPPKLTAMCKTYPALYKGQQVRYNLNYQTVDIKVWSGTDWVWLNNIKVKKHGLSRHLIDGNEIQSPALVVNKNKCQLSMPVKIKKVDREDSEFVCSVDMEINNAATASIVGKNGTVKARKFINPARDIDRRNQRRMMIKRKSSQTANITKQKLSNGFCRGLYRKSANVNLEISRKVTRGIIEFAKSHNIKVIVFENLSGWKAKAGKKGSLQKQKFHLWCHCKIVELIQQRWNELGGKVVFVNPKYTSAYAFDGSGKVKRSKVNYSLAVFQNGKQYNADLSASYNIGARYWYSLIIGDKHFSRVFVGKSSNDTLRTPVTLGTLRNLLVS